MTDEEAIRMISAKADQLAEHFDAVVILVTRMDGKTTKLHKQERGNYYARVGMARDYVANADANEQAVVLAHHINHPEE